MKSGDFFHISSTFIIKSNRKTQSTHTHTYRRTESRTETEREEELLLVTSFLTSFRRVHTKTLTGRSHASWRTALQTNKEKRTGSWSWNDRAEASETDRERETETDRHNLDFVTIAPWLTITHTPQNQIRSNKALLSSEREELPIHRSDEGI